MGVNTAALKSFAPAMRRQLIEAVGRKLDRLLTSQTPDTLTTYAKQITELGQHERENRNQLIERVAYTWFNRLSALRYLDAHNWHPFGAKVLMPATEGETQPELLKLAREGSVPSELKAHYNEGRLNGLLDGKIPTAIPGADPQGEVYRELVLSSSRSYHRLLPNLFEELDDASELLLPDDLYTEGSVAAGFRNAISDADCQNVEIIGWLYQFYISEKKDQVIGKVVKSEDIPAATQLFTPNWIVKYMVQNSLGAQWLATYPDSAIKGQMDYYIEPADQTEEVKAQLATITPSSLNPEELTLIDPACGSGHILVEAYDLFKAIYLERGYQQREVPQLILENNLFGLDIDERAAQLTSFALMMKGRADDRRLFERGVELNVIALLDSTGFDAVGLANAVALSDFGLKLADLTELKQLFEHATTFGSLIQVPQGLASRLPALKRLSEATRQDLFVSEALRRLRPLVQQAELLAAQYDAVVANPPYMGSKAMNPLAKKFAKDHFPDAKNDLFACFIERGFAFAKDTGNNAMVTMESWMFLSGYDEFRSVMLRRHTLRNLAHFPYDGKRPTVMGINFGVAVISAQNTHVVGYEGHYCCSRYYELDDSGIPVEFPTANERLKTVATDEFLRIPGRPIAYWVSEAMRTAFSSFPSLDTFASPRKGMVTADNPRFIRRWQEISISNFGRGFRSRNEAAVSRCKWFPYTKGGSFRRWAGNYEHVVNWENDGHELLHMQDEGYKVGSTNHNLEFIFRPAITWTKVTSIDSGFRVTPAGFLFDDASGVCPIIVNDAEELVLAVLNTPITMHMLHALNPTLNLNPGNLCTIPLDTRQRQKVAVDQCIVYATRDWDAYERSWDFQSLPVLTASSDPTPTLESSYTAWISQNEENIAEMKRLEEENNRLFIDAYGLQEELTPDVPIEQITLTVNPAYRYGSKLTEDELWIRFRSDTMEELLSYAVGCMMGRYSLDIPGLIYANSGNDGFDPSKYTILTADADAILPVLDGQWFEDDIVSRSRDFLRVAYPGSNPIDNLRFLEEAIGKNLRKYFCSEFYKSHLQTYKNRPIYWMVQSPKKGFSCLIYLHRYTKDTLNLVLNYYFRPYLQKLEARLAQLGLDQLNDDLPTRERTAARKEAEKITKVLRECQQWEQDSLLPVAQQRIELDLDDGVKVNYLKLQDVLAPIPGLAAKED